MSITYSYFTANGYPRSDFLEYPFLIGQDLVLFMIYAHYRQSPPIFTLVVAVLYFSTVYCLANKIIPLFILGYLTVKINFKLSRYEGGFKFEIFPLR